MVYSVYALFYSNSNVEYWKTLRGNYRRAVLKLAKWRKQLSGSGIQKGKKPRKYKYTAELSFLDVIFQLEETDDSMQTTPHHATGDIETDNDDDGDTEQVCTA